MKNLYYLILNLLILLICSCEKTDYIKYDLSQNDGVFLPYDETNDSVFYNFGFDSKEEFNYPVIIKLMGMPREYDRIVNIKKLNDYQGTEFEIAKEEWYKLPSQFTFRKNLVQDTLFITLLRHPDLETERGILHFQLEDSESLIVRGKADYTITFDDANPPRPIWWLDYKYGVFTKFKGQLFFKYFWEMEQENKYLYDIIVEEYGHNLERGGFGWQYSPLFNYEFAFTKYVDMKMWKYSEAHPELELLIQEPTIR